MIPVARRSVLALIAATLLPAAIGVRFPIGYLVAGVMNGAVLLLACIEIVRFIRLRIEITVALPPTASIGRSVDCDIAVSVHGPISASATVAIIHPASWSVESAPESAPLRTGSTMFSVVYRTARRGRFEIDAVHVRVVPDASLLTWIVRRPTGCSVEVLPDLPLLGETIALFERDRLNHLGIHSTSLAGHGSEVGGLRDYGPDDDARHIDWRVSTRVQRPVIRTFQHESGGLVSILLDTGRHMSAEENGVSALDHALNAILVLAGALAQTGDRVQIIAFNERIVRHHPPVSGRSMPLRVARSFAGVDIEFVESNYRLACEYFLRATNRRSLVFVVTDIVDDGHRNELAKWLGRLSVRHTPVLVLLRDTVLFAEASALSGEAPDDFVSAAARDMVLAREEAVDLLRANRLSVLDVNPSHLTVPLVDTYLRHRAHQTLVPTESTVG